MEPNGPILKKTFVTVAIMLGAWMAFIGTVSTAAVLITSHAVGAPVADEDKAPSSATTPADKSGVGTGSGSSTSAKHAAPQRI